MSLATEHAPADDPFASLNTAQRAAVEHDIGTPGGASRPLLVIAGATQRELARQIRYLKVENEVLRSKLPARISVTPKER